MKRLLLLMIVFFGGIVQVVAENTLFYDSKQLTCDLITSICGVIKMGLSGSGQIMALINSTAYNLLIIIIIPRIAPRYPITL